MGIILIADLVSNWGISSAGRASRLHREGQRFDPVMLHHFVIKSRFMRDFFYKKNVII